MSNAYSIVGWEKFENCRTRQVKRLHWVSLPVAMDGDWFGFLMGHPNGLRNYGLYVALVQIAANTPVRGVLADDRGPFTPKRIAMMVRTTEDVVVEGLRVLSDPEVGLISQGCTTLHNSAQPCEDSPVCLSVLSVVSVPEPKPEQNSSLRFVADRTIRTGDVPPGFKMFKSQYPKGHLKDDAGTLAVWTAQNLEPLSEQILAGLAKWARSDAWVDGCVDGAIKFLSLALWEKDPPPNKPRKGVPAVQPPAKPKHPNHQAIAGWWLNSLDDIQRQELCGDYPVASATSGVRTGYPPPVVVSQWEKAVSR